MKLLVDKVISSMVQIVVFTAFPFGWWAVTARKDQKFWEWIGFKRMTNVGKALVWMIGVSIAFIPVGVLTLYLLRGIETAASEFSGMGAQAILPIIVYAVFNTALPEELLFRGFLLKRAGNKFGFAAGNIMQAALFGLMHGVMLFAFVGAVRAVLITVFTGIIAWFMGYINERQAGGSVIPGWIIHAVSNIFSGICSAFLIV